MRIIAGKYRGKKLFSPTWDDVRPTSDKVRESVFNILQTYVGGTDCLDLFAGSGALGIEALSRGANSVTFCDRDRRAVLLVKKNLAHVLSETAPKSDVLLADFERAGALLAGRKFDIIFLDPPYAFSEIEKLFGCVRGLLAGAGKIVYEYAGQKELPVLGKGFTIERQYKYGRIGILLISSEDGNAGD